ncbi:Metal-dependent_hydrolase [Hexamita inflata]|uniref:Metal-dependent hydrolase n=1 Tax=Hexamita inflata TaxID=28002 RepID=A0AA86QHI9_9EUKA|nr:Metal-dependent hydrolase [Hexamita inflata]
MKIHFTGTHAGYASKFGQTTGFVIESDSELIVVDVPENTQQLIQQMNLSLSKITVICITHMHLDHIAGLISLLSTLLTNNSSNKISLLGPVGIQAYVDFYLKSILLVPQPASLQIIELSPLQRLDFDHFSLQTVNLKHVVTCLGYFFDFKSTNILFALDTNLNMNKEELKQLYNVQWFVTECTFKSEQISKCESSGHSCPKFIAEIQEVMKPVNIIVSHMRREYQQVHSAPKIKEIKATRSILGEEMEFDVHIAEPLAFCQIK